jgi:hypothetical protein
MEEVENSSVQQEIAQEVATPQTESSQDRISQEQPSHDEGRQDRNWRELRRAKEEWERKAKMQEELLQRLISQQGQVAAHQHLQEEEDIIHDISKEEYVPGEKVAKGFKKLEEKFDRRVQEIERRYEEKHKNALFSDLKREFPDFDDIVNPETLTLLEETNPRLANTIASSKDPYSIAVQSYEYIKAKGLSNKVSPSKRAQEVETKLEQNKKTVQSPQAFEKRPMAAAFKMTEDMKKELQREMYQYAQQAGMGY